MFAPPPQATLNNERGRRRAKTISAAGALELASVVACRLEETGRGTWKVPCQRL
ncbi:hypothetical protein K788_0008170 [Paraburkholderia caribensis MBA4]|uniref:Uncharacterized protein n=1 Tax=Paraburkholderia caribensis MBA4 TaxID=1323664 RepID=A0A0P0R8R4_9BURK|nr:hypothetical protein K788_0008170 [Paraburkholderia caribensis MBA4]